MKQQKKGLDIKWIFLLFLVVNLICYAIYSIGFSGPFVLDDRANLTQAIVKDLSWDSLSYAAQTNTSGLFGRSASAFTFALSGYFDPSLSTAYYFKQHNVFIHLLCGLFLFLLSFAVVKRLFPERNKAIYIALVASILWLLHPFSVSTVLYSVQRMVQLSALFSIISLLIYCYARNSLQEKPLLNGIFLFLFFPLNLVLGLLSKENAVTVVLAVILCEYLMFGFSFKNKAAKTIVCSFLLIFVVLPIVVSVIYFCINPGRFIDYGSRDFNLIERVYTQLHVVPYYIRLIFLPDIGEMSLYHDDFPIQRVFDLQTALLLLFIISLFAVAVYYRKKRPIITFGILWFFVCHLLESTVIPLEIIFEHRNYLALYGFMLIIASVIFRLKAKVAILVSASVILLYAALTFARVGAWTSLETLSYTMVVNHPESVRANLDYGNMLLTKKMYDEGRSYIEKVKTLQPEDAGVYIHLLLIDCHQNTLRDTTNLYYKEANRILVDRPILPYHLAVLEYLTKLVANDDCPQVINYQQAKQLINTALLGHGWSGLLYIYKARLEAKFGDYNEAMRLYNLAFKKSRKAWQPRIIKDILTLQVKLYKFSDAEQTLQRAKAYSKNRQNIGYLVREMELFLNKGEERLSPITNSWIKVIVDKKYDYNDYTATRILLN